MKAVVLAGGKGTRLRPYTAIFPKPLMPIGDRPILEIVIRRLVEAGITDIILAVGYLAELVKAFFDNGARLGARLQYSREETPLGTAGPLGLLQDQLDETFIVMNGDVLTSVSFSDMLSFHRQSQAIATVGLTERQAFIDFGVVELGSDRQVVNWQEKPTLKYLVSMGIYVFEPEVARMVQPNQHLDLPDLIRMLLARGESVKGFVHPGYWLDIGRQEDYEVANKDIEHVSELQML